MAVGSPFSARGLSLVASVNFLVRIGSDRSEAPVADGSAAGIFSACCRASFLDRVFAPLTQISGQYVLDIRQDDLSSEATRTLLTLHLRGMHESSPPGHVFALDISGLQQPNVTVWSAWEGDSIAGIGALKLLTSGIGEVKSMRTHPDHARKEWDQQFLRKLSTRLGRKVVIDSASRPAAALRLTQH